MPSILPLALAGAVAPAAVTWWSGRQLARRLDDPALPELLLAQSQRLMHVASAGMIVLIFFGGDHWHWALAILLAGLLLSRYPLRRALFGEQWGILSYLRYGVFSFIGGYGLWLGAAFMPAFVVAVVTNALPGDDPRRAAELAALIGAIVGGSILLWQWQYATLWLHLHRATPMAASAPASLMARLEEILDRVGPQLHRRPTIHRYGAAGGYIMNAVAIPSSHSPAVAFGDTLLATLTEDEIVAVFAHEVAHHEQFKPRLRKAWWSVVVIVVLWTALPPLLLLTVPEMASLLALIVPIALTLSFGARAARSRADETASDRRAVALTGDPAALASALRKIHVLSRVPRRWPHDFERVATHPSLARRIQAIADQGSVPATPLGAAAAIRSTKPGVAVVLDDARAHWFEGVPDDAPLDLASLRDLSSTYRALAYPDLTELRVAALGDERMLKATDREGRSWVVALRREDIQVVQAALDVVDVRLGSRRASSGHARSAAATTLALVVFLSLMLAQGLPLLMLPLLLMALRPAATALVATGTMTVVRALVIATGAPQDPVHARIAAIVAGAAGVALLYFGIRAIERRDPRTASLDEPAWRDSKWVILAIAGPCVLMLLSILPTLMNAPASVMEHPLALSFVTALLGLSAALLTFRRRRWRVAGGGLSTCAAAAILGVVGDGWLFNRSSAFTWSDRSAHAIASFSVDARASTVQLSPGGDLVMVRQFASSRYEQSGISRFTVGRVARDSVERVRAPLSGLAASFLDDVRILALDVSDDDSLTLRAIAIPTSPTTSALDTLWRRRLQPIEDPQLFVDRAHNAWIIAGRDPAHSTLVIVNGSANNDSIQWHSVPPDESTSRAIAAFRNGTALAPMAPRPRKDGVGIPWLYGLSSFSLHWDVARVGSVVPERAGGLNGYPTCGTVISRLGALCVESGRRRARIWRAPEKGELVQLAVMPASYDVMRAVDGDRLTAASRFEARVALVDVVARTAITVRLPEGRPSQDWLSDAAWGGDRVALLRSGRGSRVSIYLVDGDRAQR